jgi:hypothetical protein
VAGWDSTIRTAHSLDRFKQENRATTFRNGETDGSGCGNSAIARKATEPNGARVWRLGVPDGPFLKGCDGAALREFEKTLGRLADGG